ncbi:ABC transporter permease [bacterium]|nr:ABC transporter permease [bacterium]
MRKSYEFFIARRYLRRRGRFSIRRFLTGLLLNFLRLACLIAFGLSFMIDDIPFLNVLSAAVFLLLIILPFLKSRKTGKSGGSAGGFINIITYISIFGVMIGVAALIIVLSVMNGFESEVRNRIIGFDTHIRLRTYHDRGIEDYGSVEDSLRDIPEITGMSPYILDKGMLRHQEYTAGVLVKAADPRTISQVSDLDKNIVYGELNLDQVRLSDGRKRHGIVLGRYLADQVWADTGDVVLIMSPKGIRSMFQVPEVMPFIVTGYFETGMFEYDNSYAFISIEAAQDLFKLGDKVSGIEIRLKDVYQAERVVKKIDDRLGFPYFALSWFEMRKNLFAWMQLEKIAMFIILCLIIIVAAFNIISTLIMVVMEKTKEIGILKSMGSTSGSIMRIFLYEGLVVGVLGTLLGELIGYGLCWAQQTFHLISLPPDVYFITSLPIRMQPSDFIVIGLAAIVLCLLAGVYPARRAASLDPVKAIRYE